MSPRRVIYGSIAVGFVLAAIGVMQQDRFGKMTSSGKVFFVVGMLMFAIGPLVIVLIRAFVMLMEMMKSEAESHPWRWKKK
jgi:hypothetical protein